jgi:putative spermidine/putrescine transport system substrate-binding protein
MHDDSVDQGSMDRAGLLKQGAALSLAVGVGGLMVADASASGLAGLSDEASKSLVYSTWGGSWQDALKKAWADPFSKKTGIKVTFTGTPDYGKIAAMVKNHATTWDIAEVEQDFAVIGAKKRLLEPIDYSVVRLNGVPKGLATKYAVPQLFWSQVLTYRTDKFGGKKMNTWSDLWDMTTFPGKRTFYSLANGGVFEAALLADGVKPENLYPLDLKRAFAKLDEIKQDILWYETGSQMTQYFSDGSAAAGVGWDGRISLLIQQGIPVAFTWNQAMILYSMMVVPKGAPHKDAAMQFLNYALAARPQAAAAKVISYGPVNSLGFKYIPDKIKPTLSGNPTEKKLGFRWSATYWANNLDLAQEKLQAWRTS